MVRSWRVDPRQGHLREITTRLMAPHVQTSDLSVAATELRALDTLGFAQHLAARLFAVTPRSIRRWRDGSRRIPHAAAIGLKLLASGTITIAEVEQAAVLTPVPTTGGAKPAPRAPLIVKPEQSALAGAKAAVCALTLGTCRWPIG